VPSSVGVNVEMVVEIDIVNYGVGNLYSVTNALRWVGAKVRTVKDSNSILNSKCIVFPGVGAFGEAMKNLADIKEKLVEKLNNGTPALGLCLGMQILFEKSEESADKEGLGFIKGHVVRLGGVNGVKTPKGSTDSTGSIRIPQMGWNAVKISRKDAIFDGIEQETEFYFANSFVPQPKEDVVIATSEYGIVCPAVVKKKNAYGVQFHPEKSSKHGLKLLENFVEFTGSVL
jgi:glutamine amidotransferase